SSFGANATPERSGQTIQVCPLPHRRGLAFKIAGRAATGSFEIGSTCLSLLRVWHLMVAALMSPGMLSASQPLPLPRHAMNIVTYAKEKMSKIEQARSRLVKAVRKRASDDLRKEMDALILDRDLDRAVATRELARRINEGEPLEQISPDDTRYRQNTANIVNSSINRIGQIEQSYLKNRQTVLADLEKELSREMVRLDRIGSIAPSLDIKAFIALLESPDFDLLAYECIEKEESPSMPAEAKASSTGKVPPAELRTQRHELVLRTAIALGNNLLAGDIFSEKGLAYLCFAENIAPEDHTIKELRKKIEQRVFLPVMPCQFDENAFYELAAELCRTASDDSVDLGLAVKYALLLAKLDPKSRDAEPFAGLLKKSPGKADFDSVFSFSRDMFGGSEEAGDIRLKVEGASPEKITQLIVQAEALRQKYPKNDDVRNLLEELRGIKPKASPAGTGTPKADRSLAQENKIACPACKGAGWIEEKCTHCKSSMTKDGVCARCVGSGFIFEEVECDECKGQGKNFFGFFCKKCQGKGKVRVKIPCPECQAAKQGPVCSHCGGSGVVRRKCPECNGTGQIEK
ncbi:MAG: hypothetical protein JW808_09345, partial [Victivallales bacterium]|nr:hypothetical protein [Victivallales bacterium]